MKYINLFVKTMPNNRQKGRRAELEFAQILKSRGYIVEITPPPQRFKKQQDFFGCFDLLSFKKDESLFVQVKSNTTQGAIKKIKAWKEANPLPEYFKFVVAVRKDGNSHQEPTWKEIYV